MSTGPDGTGARDRDGGAAVRDDGAESGAVEAEPVEPRQPTSARRSTRAVLGIGVGGGILTLLVMPLLAPVQVGIASDVYYYAAEAALAGDEFYGVHPPGLPEYTFLYPPIVVLAFVPHVLLGGPQTALALQTVLNLAALSATALLLLRALERRGVALARVDRALVAAFAVGSVWTANLLVMGQTTPWLALGVAAGLDALDRDRESLAGLAVGLVALVKVFPAALGAWFLRRRATGALGVAVATGLGGLALGALVFGPETTAQYVTEVLLGRHESEAFGATPDPTRNHATARRQVAALLGGGSPLVPLLAVGLVAPAVAYCYRDLSTDVRRLAAVLATLVGTLLVLPLQPLYMPLLYYPVVLLLFLLPSGRERRLLLAGTLASFLLIEQSATLALLARIPAVGDAVRAALRATLTVVQPATVGFWSLLAAAVAIHRTDQGDRLRERE